MIVITTPTGSIGRRTLEHVLESGEPVRVIARDASRLPENTRDRIEVVKGSHGGRDVVDQAFAGADAVFWLVPPHPRASSAEAAYADFTRPAAQALKRHGIEPSTSRPVLVVDDDPQALKLAAEALRQLGYRPICRTEAYCSRAIPRSCPAIGGILREDFAADQIRAPSCADKRPVDGGPSGRRC